MVVDSSDEKTKCSIVLTILQEDIVVGEIGALVDILDQEGPTIIQGVAVRGGDGQKEKPGGGQHLLRLSYN